MNFVLDTNVIVSALYRKDSIPFMVYSYAFSEGNFVYYTEEIYKEYDRVLNEPRLKFKKDVIVGTLSFIIKRATYTSVVKYHYNKEFVDESDRKFYELAKNYNCYLVTGNKKDFPKDPIVISPKELINKLSHLA